MNNAILHILVIWSKAQANRQFILDDLRKDFELLKIITVHWDKEMFLQNFMVFYAHSQYHLAYKAFRDLLEGKVEHCGNEDFTVVILRDDNPVFENRITTSGERKVNTRIFDKKAQYRTLTGGGHKIHSSDDAWETNHDLTVMFGLNTEDFCSHFTLDGGETTISQNCQGVGGYKSIEKFFYVLNNTIRYVVMRNHECIPDQYTVEGHGDIDLLCDNKNWMAYLTAAKPIFEESYRVYHTINIGGIDVPFDFRYVGDNYYDQPWQEDILSTRVLQKKLFYTPNPENQYYTLLYHAYVQKYEIKEDYPPKLSLYAEAINVSYNPDVKATILQLDDFLHKRQYEYIRPVDETVVYNLEHVAMSKYALRHGQLIKRLDVYGSDNRHYHSRVYEKTDSFIKIGTPWLIDNETTYLQRVNSNGLFPIVLSNEYDQQHDETILEISRVLGTDYNHFFGNAIHQTASNVRNFINGSIQLLITLAEKNVAHRDFLPSNVMISSEDDKLHVGLIDFGWATDIDKASINRPDNLGAWYTSSDNHTDAYNFGMFLLDYWYDLPYIRIISKQLRSISDSDAMDTNLLISKYRKILNTSRFSFTPYDSWRLLCRRHLRIGWIKDYIIRIIKH